jgi:hypothetical protein
MKKFSIKAGLLAAMAVPFSSISPALAGPFDPPLSPVPCSGFYSVTQLTAAGFGCFQANKQYFGFSGFSGLGPTAGFTFTQFGTESTFSGAGLNFTGSSFSYNYSVALYNPLPGQSFLSYNTDASGSSTGGSLTYSKSLSTIAPGPVSGPSTSSEGSGGGNLVLFAGGETGPVIFSSTLTRTGGKIDNITDSLNQAFDPSTNEVPGPLPLLGAGAAFGFSRRLRSRIKQVA